jgi:hypothetical protein
VPARSPIARVDTARDRHTAGCERLHVMRRIAVTLALVLFGTTLGMSHAGAQPAVDRAAQALRQDPVFVDPSAERALSASDAVRLRDQIRASGQPIFVAILPGTTFG